MAHEKNPFPELPELPDEMDNLKKTLEKTKCIPHDTMLTYRSLFLQNLEKQGVACELPYQPKLNNIPEDKVFQIKPPAAPSTHTHQSRTKQALPPTQEELGQYPF